MSIRQTEDIGKRGPSDARRHREKQKKAIKEKLPEIISEENIITSRKGRKVKISIRSLHIPRLRPGHRKQGEGGEGGGIGVGQGPGKPGDIIGRRPGEGKQTGKAGEEPGEDYIETEVDIEELVEMMLEDMGLPNVQEKELAEIEISLGFKISGLRKTGPRHMLSIKQTIREGLKTFWRVLELLKTETGLEEKICFWALKKSEGTYEDALKLLQQTNLAILNEVIDEVEPFPIFDFQDMRYYNLQEEKEKESNAVVLVMLDVSGSMEFMKKYMARSVMFWLTEFLMKIYKNVEIRFIIYHTEARIVDEYTAFHTTESGGTKAISAYELAQGLIETEYPTNKWNVYVFHFSDGDDFVPEQSVQAAKKLIEQLGINMLGYIEINVDSWGRGNLMPAFIEHMPLNVGDSNDIEMYVGETDYQFVGVIIEGKEDVWPTIQQLLRKDRWLA